MYSIEHNYALDLENLVCKLYKCECLGAFGLINADRFERQPFDAAIMVISYIYAKELTDDKLKFESFIDKYDTIFKYPEENNADCELKNYISDLAEIVKKYV